MPIPGRPVGGSTMADRRGKPSASVLRLQEAIKYLLNEQEQGEFRQIITDYHSRRNLTDFCHALGVLLDTPAKRQILKHLRKVVREADATRFSELMAMNATKSSRSTLELNGIGASVPWETRSLPRRIQAQLGGTLDGRLRSRGSPSVVSAPAYHYGTLPLPGSKIIKRPIAHTDFLANGRTSDPESDARAGRLKHIRLEQPANPATGLGFSIRGGAEHGIGIYVSYVDPGSIAERRGLKRGDQILAVNGVSFRRITHTEAAKIVKSSQTIDMEVRYVGRIPGSFETHESYTWVDENGRTVSPPPEVERAARYMTSEGRRSGLMLLKDTDERKVNLVVSESKTLGISIRGGKEFGLGIYITHVDYGSPAENAGLKVGDQILDVNGRTFLDISHGDAVKVLKSSKHLMITVKDVGKLPYTRTVYDHTEWISDDNITKLQAGTPDLSCRSETNSVIGRFASTQPADSIFSRGAGSQLMHNSVMSQNTHMALIEEGSRRRLTEDERTALRYYIDEYQKGTIQVEALLLALFEILKTKTKFALLTDIRGVIQPKDLKTFDHLVLQKEVTLLKSKSMETLYPLPRSSDEESLDLFHTHYGWPTTTSTQHTTQASEEEMEALRKAIELMENDRVQEIKNEKKGRRLKLGFGSLKGKKKRSARRSPSPRLEVDTHSTPDTSKRKQGTRCPSEDSGVELTGPGHTPQNKANKQSSQQHNTADGFHGKYMSLGKKNAYSLIDTPIADGHSDQDGALSSLSDFEESLDNRMHMFKMLPAQFESEMVHANIQTEEDWSYASDPFGSLRRPKKAIGLRPAASEGDVRDGQSLAAWRNGDTLRPGPPSPRSDILDASERRNGPIGHSPVQNSESRGDEIQKPTKPPRSNKRSSRATESRPSAELPWRAQSIPNISLDTTARSDLWSVDGDAGLPMVPPAPSAGELDTSSNALDADHYKIYDIPFDDVDISCPAPFTETNCQLSPIAIVPPPPPMDPMFGEDLDNLQVSKAESECDEGTPEEQTTGSNEMKYVVISKTRPTLGLAIEGGANTRQPLPRIINIQPNGAAALCGDLDIGDVIVEVNGRSLDGMVHRQCAKAIATAFKDKQTDSITLAIIKCSRKMKL